MYGSSYATATTGININKCVISLLKHTDNEIPDEDKSELKMTLQGIKDLKGL